jgi:hypothetical protein
VMGELQGVIWSLLLIEENCEYLHVAYPVEGHRYIHRSLSYQDDATKVVVDKAIL